MKPTCPPEPIQVEGKLLAFVALPDGRLLSLYPEARKAVQWRDTSIPQRILRRYSHDHGRTWEEPEEVYRFPQEEEGSVQFPFALYADAEGTLHQHGFIFYKWDKEVPYSERKITMWKIESHDGGRVWTEPRDVDYGHRYTGSLNEVTVLSSGRIVIPFSYMSRRETGVFVSTALLSDDNGKTWRNARTDIVIDSGGPYVESGAVEPVTVELPDGRVWMVIRTQTGKLYESYSEDGGDTWSDPSPTSFVSSNSPAGLLKLRDGRILMVWNHAKGEPIHHGLSYARQSLVAAIREPDGEWRGYREIVGFKPDAPIDDLVCYPWMVETADGCVLVGYLEFLLTSFEGTFDFNLVRIDPDWVAQEEAEEDWTRSLTGITTTPSGAEVREEDGATCVLLQAAGGLAPAGMTWNFPYLVKGTTTLRIRVDEGFGGAVLTWSESFALPGGPLGGMFRLRLEADGKLSTQYENEGPYLPLKAKVALVPGTWADLALTWDCAQETATLTVDGTYAGMLPQLEQGRGVSYLRMRTVNAGEGLRVKSLRSRVSRRPSVMAVPAGQAETAGQSRGDEGGGGE